MSGARLKMYLCSDDVIESHSDTSNHLDVNLFIYRRLSDKKKDF